MRILLPIELTNRNDGRGYSWHRTQAERQIILSILRAAGCKRSVPLGKPVDLTITRILGRGQQLWDADSVLRGNAKELIDSLTELGWWPDDGPKWIRHCDGRQDASRRQIGPAVELHIRIAR